jgi:ribosomal protein S18 acetylase RimI-like enzyme
MSAANAVNGRDVPVRRATRADRTAVVRALVRAFDNDPVARYLLRQDNRRAEAYHNLFDIAFDRLCIQHDETWIAGEGAGTALWTPPSKWAMAPALTRVHQLIGCIGLTRVPHVLRILDRVQKGHPSAPHYYLVAIGVDPDHQGRGIGSSLLRATLSRVDAEGASAYLEASTEGNSRLYGRHGFKVLETLKLGSDGPPMWLMWRDPQRA